MFDRHDPKLQFADHLLICTSVLHSFAIHSVMMVMKGHEKDKHITYTLYVILIHFVQIMHNTTIFALYFESAKYEAYAGWQ
jgi:hypothetical protein